jgi:hypothetical protein
VIRAIGDETVGSAGRRGLFDRLAERPPRIGRK